MMWKLLMLVLLSCMATVSRTTAAKPKTISDVGMLAHFVNARFLEMEEILRELKAQMLTKCNVWSCCSQEHSHDATSNPFDESKTFLGAFKKRKETSHIDCERIIKGDNNYLKEIIADRPVLVTRNLSMCCNDIRSRVMGPVPMRKIQFGVAHARIVHSEYEFIEEELRSAYHAQNHFCYSIGKRADKDFKEKIKRLASCFPNVVVAPEEFNFDGNGRNISEAFYSCMKLLSKRPGWEYMILILNWDVIIKSPYEMVEIYSILNGANDVQMEPAFQKFNHDLKWDARSLKLFVDESSASPQQLNATLKFASGSPEVSLSRAAVEWLVDTVNLTTLLDQINKGQSSINDLLLPSLQCSDGFDMPGRFTSECVKLGKLTTFFTIEDQWLNTKELPCRSHYMTNESWCVFGMENLEQLAKSTQLMAWQFLPNFDYGVVDCIHEVIFNRTFLSQVDHPLNLDYYRNQPHQSSINDLLLPSLQCSDGFDMPGRFTSECVKLGKLTTFFTIEDQWLNTKELPCRSRYMTNESWCVFGMENLEQLAKSTQLMAWQFLPNFDYGVVDCIHEVIFNRTFLSQVDHPLNLDYYRNQPHQSSINDLLLPSLQCSDGFDMPGRFTSECVKLGKLTTFFTIEDQWLNTKELPCRSRYMTNESWCVFGMENLEQLAKSTQLMAWQFLPNFDYGVVDCIHEVIFNRTFLSQVDHPLNLDYYRNQPHVKFHNNQKHLNAKYTLKCD